MSLRDPKYQKEANTELPHTGVSTVVLVLNLFQSHDPSNAQLIEYLKEKLWVFLSSASLDEDRTFFSVFLTSDALNQEQVANISHVELRIQYFCFANDT